MTPASEPSQTRVGLGPGDRADRAIRAVLLACAEDFERHRARVMRSADPEGPHGARVALRRLRTALGAFRGMLRRAPRRALAQEARALFRLLGELRDADVLAGQAMDGPRAAALAQEARRTRTCVRAALEARGADGFAARVARATEGGHWVRRSARRAARGPISGPAAGAMEVAWQGARAHGKRVARLDSEARHGLRKDLKALRYLSEFFAPLWPGRRQRRFLKRLKRLQEALGTLNDLSVAEARLGAEARDARAVQAQDAMVAADRDWRRLRRMRRWWGRAPA
ncbi:MAG: CHAD domain-containing protein [Alkalilacustris sp.]